MFDDVPLDVQSRCYLDKFQATWSESEDAAFGDVVDGLSAPAGVFAAEGDLTDLLLEFRDLALFEDLQSAVGDGQLRARPEQAEKVDLFRGLADVDEPAGSVLLFFHIPKGEMPN